MSPSRILNVDEVATIVELRGAVLAEVCMGVNRTTLSFVTGRDRVVIGIEGMAVLKAGGGEARLADRASWGALTLLLGAAVSEAQAVGETGDLRIRFPEAELVLVGGADVAEMDSYLTTPTGAELVSNGAVTIFPPDVG